MTHVGRQRQHLLVDLGTVGVPARQSPDGKGVVQVVQAGGLMSAAIEPAEAIAQAGKDAVHLSLAGVETPLQEKAEIMSSSKLHQPPAKPRGASFSQPRRWKLNIIGAST